MSADKPPVTSLLTDPDAFFRERSEDPSIVPPLAIVTLIAVVGSFATLVQNETIVSAFRPVIETALENSSENMSESDIQDAVDFAVQAYLVFSYGAALIGPYFFWLLYAAVFHGISVVFDGEGSFGRTLRFVGWGRLPMLVASVVTLLVNVYYYEIVGVDVPSDVSAENQFEAFQELGPPTEIQLLTTVVGILLTLWAAYIWVYGMKHARNLSRREALLTVSVPVLISLLLQIQTLFATL